MSVSGLPRASTEGEREFYNCAGRARGLIAKLIGVDYAGLMLSMCARARAAFCTPLYRSRSKCEMGFERGRFAGTFRNEKISIGHRVQGEYNELVSTNARNFDEFLNVQTGAKERER